MFFHDIKFSIALQHVPSVLLPLLFVHRCGERADKGWRSSPTHILNAVCTIAVSPSKRPGHANNDLWQKSGLKFWIHLPSLKHRLVKIPHYVHQMVF